MTRIPLLLVGDGPAESTGLGRIARDLAGLIVSSDLPLDLVQIGGTVPPPWTKWKHYPLDRGNDWGAQQVQQYWRDLWGDQPGILWWVWDPGRLAEYLSIDLPVQKWAYVPIDAENNNGIVSGPAQAALELCDRVLAYGRWGSQVLKRSLPDRSIPYLPHGIVTETFAAPATPEEQAWVQAVFGPHVGQATVIGMVAANQPRKDLAIFCATLDELRRRGRNVYGWLHTDVLVKAWAVPQLQEDFDLRKRMTVTTAELSDRQLALLYQRCDLTLLSSLGEGFGYPLVESLAAGTPVIHGDQAGGAELVPKLEWRVPSRGWRLESVYALRRPVFDPTDWANAVERALGWREQIGPSVCAAYCRGAVAHLDWVNLWPRWSAWIRAGLV